jgi:hypothetical protein
MKNEPIGKPFEGPDGETFEDFDACVAHFDGDDAVDDPEAFCAWLEGEGKDALSDPDAEDVLTDLRVEFVSAVDEPAQDSEWLIAKSVDDPDGERHEWGVTTPLLVRKDADEAQVAFAPVLIPGEVDKQGDVIPDHEIERAAWDYIKHFRKVDTDHDLLDGKGTPVESFTLKEDRTFDLPDGGESREYPAGTWVLGIEFEDDAWKRVKSGDLSGLSIYGGASPFDADELNASFGSAKSVTKHDTVTMFNQSQQSKQLEDDALASFADAISKFLAETGQTVDEANLGGFFEWATDERIEDVDDTVEVGGVEIPIRPEDGGGGMMEADGGGEDDDEIADALKAVAGAVDGLEDRVAALEDEAGVADFANDRMNGSGENGRTQSVKAILGDDGDADVARKAIREQPPTADGDLSVDYSGITDDEDADPTAKSTSGSTRSSSANPRMVDEDN